jgi:GH18 family chitinase
MRKRRKCDYAKKLGTAGVMIWHVGADVDGTHAPLMDALAESCGANAQALGRAATEIQISAMQEEPVKGSVAIPTADVLSEMSEKQLEYLQLRLQKDWASAQEKLWEEQALQRGKKMN